MKIQCKKCKNHFVQEQIKSCYIRLLEKKFYFCHWCVSEHVRCTLDYVQDIEIQVFTMTSKVEIPLTRYTLPFSHASLNLAFKD